MDIRRRSKISAWPLLGGLQILILSMLIVAGLRTLPPRPPPMSERLDGLDLRQAGAGVTDAIAAADSGRALQPDDEQRATLFLQLLSQAAELRLLSLTLNPSLTAPAEEGLFPVDATLSLTGDPFNLPIFLDGLQRQRAVNHVVSVKGRGGVIGEFKVRVRYYRPSPPRTDWIAARLAEEEPEHAGASDLLEQAAWLSVWRRFQFEERGLVARAAQIRARVSRELAAPLIEVRAGGGTLSWDEEQGARQL
ncbi:MAG: hypothetical protein P8R54_12850 [Myxococcota bacterium]|nr:hypothetical protein [Myxococcota bacterium]